MTTPIDPDDVEVVEVIPGELDATIAGRTCRVVVPAGVGIPGLEDHDLVAGLLAELHRRGRDLPALLDVSQVVGAAPDLLDAVERWAESLDEAGPDGG